MEAEGAGSNSMVGNRAFHSGLYQRPPTAPTASARRQGPASAAHHNGGSSCHGDWTGQNFASPSPARSVIEQGALDSSTLSGHQTGKMLYSSPIVNNPNVVLTPALSFRSRAMASLRREQFQPNMIHSEILRSTPPNMDNNTIPLEPSDGGKRPRFSNNGFVVMEDGLPCFVPNACEGTFRPRGPFAADMNPRSDAATTSVPFSQHHEADLFQKDKIPFPDFTQSEELPQIVSNAANGQGFGNSKLTSTPPTCAPHQGGLRDPTLPHPSADQSHSVPKLYNPNRDLDLEAGVTEQEVRHHYLPFHHLSSLVARRSGGEGPMVGPAHGCFGQLRPDSRASVSSASSNDTLTAAHTVNGVPTLADLVRESEPEDMLLNPKANEANAEYITPSAATYLNATQVPTPSGAPIHGLWFFPGDRDFLWTYSRAPAPPSLPTEFQEAPARLHSNSLSGNNTPTTPMTPNPREIMATYTSSGGWRTMPRGHYSGSRFGAVGERLVPLTMDDVAEEEAGTAVVSANDDTETHASQ